MSRRGTFRVPWGLIIFEGIVLLLIAGLMLAQALLVRIPDSQDAAGRWSNGGERFAQVSVFLEKGAGLTVQEITAIRTSVDKALMEASMAPEDGKRAWLDAYHTAGVLTFTSNRASLEAEVVGVGGDFFHFHPFELHSGYYFSDSEASVRLLIDEATAWQLFGSYDVAGLELKVGQRPFVIAGVYKSPTDFASRAALGDSPAPRVYMSYAALAELDETVEITCYEAVTPDPVSGFGQKLITDAVGTESRACQVLENSRRFGFVPLLQLIGQFGQRSMQRTPIALPYWENAARMVEEYAALMQLLWMLLSLIPLAGLAILIVALWKNRRFHLQDIPDIYERILSEYRLRRREKALRQTGKSSNGGQDL